MARGHLSEDPDVLIELRNLTTQSRLIEPEPILAIERSSLCIAYCRNALATIEAKLAHSVIYRSGDRFASQPLLQQEATLALSNHNSPITS